MSIIVWDGKTLAADRQASNGNLIQSTRKIYEHQGSLLAIVGTHASLGALLNWFYGGQKLADFPRSDMPPDNNATMWVISPAGRISKYEASPFPIIYNDKTFADGSGRDFAYGAMAMGADAEQAVIIASKHDIYCGGGVDVLVRTPETGS